MKEAFTKQVISWYNFGALILFLGLLWMFLPHTVHNAILGPEEAEEHFVHIFQGVVIAIAGIVLMVLESRRP